MCTEFRAPIPSIDVCDFDPSVASRLLGEFGGQFVECAFVGTFWRPFSRNASSAIPVNTTEIPF
jgi:hypothetical protein